MSHLDSSPEAQREESLGRRARTLDAQPEHGSIADVIQVDVPEVGGILGVYYRRFSMATVTDPSPELAYLGEVICERLEAGVAPPADDPYRVVLLAASAIGTVLHQSSEAASDSETAFLTRDTAVRAAADLILAVTCDPVEIRLIREDLMTDMTRICGRAEDALGNLDPRLEGKGFSLWAAPHLASLAETVLTDPEFSEAASRACVLEDVCNLLTVLLGLAWRLRAWAFLEQA